MIHRLKITLKQHTPLLHFQATQEGATLRASEVKPKLDKFIKKHNHSKASELEAKNLYKYKLKIISNINDLIDVKLTEVYRDAKYYTKTTHNDRLVDFPLILSNMGGKRNRNDLCNLIMHKQIKLIVIADNKEITNLIEDNIVKFFGTTNFGQRSSKGFGSFIVTSVNGKHQKFNPHELFDEDSAILEFRVNNNDSTSKQISELFKTIDFYWKCLKSGINYTRGNPNSNRYIKSYLYHYLNNYGNIHTTWEKRAIKEHFRLYRLEQMLVENPNTHYFGRALLGCMDKFEYLRVDNRALIQGKHIVNITNINDNEQNKITRIPSPIIFKPVKIGDLMSIYILINHSIKDELINHINTHGNIRYSFECTGRGIPLELEVNPHTIDYKELIDGFSEYLWSEEENRIRIFEGRNDLLRDEEYEWKFIPRDHNWRNILGNRVVSILFI
ncbi:MAG: hypothetical protein R3Y04_03945 [Rikenellaceae bacterium]